MHIIQVYASCLVIFMCVIRQHTLPSLLWTVTANNSQSCLLPPLPVSPHPSCLAAGAHRPALCLYESVPSISDAALVCWCLSDGIYFKDLRVDARAAGLRTPFLLMAEEHPHTRMNPMPFIPPSICEHVATCELWASVHQGPVNRGARVPASVPLRLPFFGDLCTGKRSKSYGAF